MGAVEDAGVDTMTQTKAKSIQEVLVNVGTGFVVSYLLWLFVVPVLFDVETSAGQGIGITGLYTAASIGRGYIVRRVYNWRARNGS